MNAQRDPDRLISAFLLEGADQLQDQVYDAVRADIEQQRQRTVIGPWRMPTMNKFVPIGLGAAAVVAVLVIGTQLLAPAAPGGVGAASSASPSATTATATPAVTPSPSDSGSAPALTETFTSERHGITMSYPSGWVSRPATEPWTGTGGPHFPDPFADLLIDPVLDDALFLVLGSQPIGSSTPDEWVAETMAADECSATEPIAVDGATGLIGDCEIVAVTTTGRGYRIRLFTSDDDPLAVAAYDRAWFESVLATVQLRPEDAVDVAPSASP